MVPRIILFGLPLSRYAKMKIAVFTGASGNSYGQRIFSGENDDRGGLIANINSDIKIGSDITIVIMSSGICHYAYPLCFSGADISHVPSFRRELNTSEDDVSQDWDLDYWRQWNPRNAHDSGLIDEKEAIRSREISVEPVWTSYYFDSNIDYMEKFQKLWIGLNAYATHKTSGKGDQNKILALVDTPLQQRFWSLVHSARDERSEKKWLSLQGATGINMSSDILRDEIGRTCNVLRFLASAKARAATFPKCNSELGGLIFLNEGDGRDVFDHVVIKYHEHCSGEAGILDSFDLSKAFSKPFAPDAVCRYGALLFHDPNGVSSPGRLFTLADIFGTSYAKSPCCSQSRKPFSDWEKTDSLFFRYLKILYEFRCAFFHGDLPPNRSNNELAMFAYLSLRDLFPAIISK
jgi:hypothetical protein